MRQVQVRGAPRTKLYRQGCPHAGCGRAGVAFGTVAPLELELSVGLAEQEVAPVQAHDAVL